MSRLYSYYSVNDDDCLIWNVLETATNSIIDSFYWKDEAQQYARFLESGGAFSGFTPSFILKKTQIGDINSEFEMKFSEE